MLKKTGRTPPNDPQRHGKPTVLKRLAITSCVALGVGGVFHLAEQAMGRGFTAASAETGAANKPVVVELFTSQGCYSCPPAEKFLGELSETPGLVALEFHVDYWDELRYLIHGKWKDPYSSPAHTRRQQRYNHSIEGRRGVYTPQMIIDGRIGAVGSRKGDVAAAIKRAAAEQSKRLDVNVTIHGAGARVSIDGADKRQADIWVVEFLKERTTEVTSGENHGKTLVSHNIVREMTQVGEWNGKKAEFGFQLPDSTERGCAVVVQLPGPGAVLGAALCPNTPQAS